jgi:hypothetical protein
MLGLQGTLALLLVVASSVCLLTAGPSLKIQALCETVLLEEGRSKGLVQAPGASESFAGHNVCHMHSHILLASNGPWPRPTSVLEHIVFYSELCPQE